LGGLLQGMTHDSHAGVQYLATPTISLNAKKTRERRARIHRSVPKMTGILPRPEDGPLTGTQPAVLRTLGQDCRLQSLPADIPLELINTGLVPRSDAHQTPLGRAEWFAFCPVWHQVSGFALNNTSLRGMRPDCG
jgi:hypothetical protein